MVIVPAVVASLGLKQRSANSEAEQAQLAVKRPAVG